jgi:hypothetical protein
MKQVAATQAHSLTSTGIASDAPTTIMPTKPVSHNKNDTSHVALVHRIINAFSRMPRLSSDSHTLNWLSLTNHASEIVFLTGTTGALGSQLLVDLLTSQRVLRVYAYNRPMSTTTIMERHLRTFEDRFVHALPLYDYNRQFNEV